jgi:hypothetical protein
VGGAPTPTPTAGGGGGSGSSSGGSDDGTPTADPATAEPNPDESPDPNCALLEGSPTPYDAAGTPFVFTFDYVDTWELQDPLEGPGGLIQGISSPVVTVDGETESAGLTVGQKFDPLTAAEVDEYVAESTSGDYARFVEAPEQSFGGETIRVLGFADPELPFYQTWLPHGDGEARYYPLNLLLNTSILRPGEGDGSGRLCLEPTVAGIETVRESLAPNSETTIAEVGE